MEEERPAEKSPRKRRSWSEELRGEREVWGGRAGEGEYHDVPAQAADSAQPAAGERATIKTFAAARNVSRVLDAILIFLFFSLAGLGCKNEQKTRLFPPFFLRRRGRIRFV